MSSRKTNHPTTPVYTVHSPHFSQAPIASEIDHLDEVAAAHASDEFERLIDLIITREIVPLSPIDRVEVIDHALTTVQVRVIDGAERGRQGWVPASWLHSAGTAAAVAVATADDTAAAAA
jgi:hypothetical protein